MTIFRTIHNKDYTVVNNFICTDKRLSWKAKGIWLYAFSRPNDWEFNMKNLINMSSDGRDAVYSGLKELEECGYLHRDRYRDSNGRMLPGNDWCFYEVPKKQEELEVAGNPELENPHQAKPHMDNPSQLSTEFTPSIEAPIQSIENNNKQVNVGCSENSLSKDDIHFYVAKFSLDWRDHEINEAYKIYKDSKIAISDPFAYIEGIINKKRNIFANKRQKTWMTKYAISQEEKSKLEIEKPKSLEKGIGKPLLAEFLASQSKTRKN